MAIRIIASDSNIGRYSTFINGLVKLFRLGDKVRLNSTTITSIINKSLELNDNEIPGYLQDLNIDLRSSDLYCIKKFRELIGDKGKTYDSDRYCLDIIPKRISEISPMIRDSGYPLRSNSLLLDIGTERVEYLKRLSTEFGIICTGVNIEGFTHYGNKDEFSISDSIVFNNTINIYNGFDLSRLKTTSGINNPNGFKDSSVDIVTILAVIHHIGDEDRLSLFKDIYRILKPRGLLVIRDNDLVDNIVDAYSVWSHIKYELVLNGNNVLNYYNSCSSVYQQVSDLISVGFRIPENVDSWYSIEDSSAIRQFKLLMMK